MDVEHCPPQVPSSSLSPSPSLSSFLPYGKLGFCLLCVCVVQPLSRSSWERGGHLVQILSVGRTWKLVYILADPVLYICLQSILCPYCNSIILLCYVHPTSIVGFLGGRFCCVVVMRVVKPLGVNL